MTCNPSVFSDGGRLSLLEVQRAPKRKKRQVAVRKLDQSVVDNLKKQLKAELTKYMAENSILGEEMVCSSGVIESICCSLYWRIMDVFCLRQELKQRFFRFILRSNRCCIASYS